MFGVMIQGTASNVGKSFVCTALCRAFARKGIRVTPFKSQNMSNNSYVTKEGAEIGRSQGIQAEAACTEASVLMSPILLKPRNDQISEVIRFGKVYETLSGKDYRKQFYEIGLETIKESLSALEQQYEAIIIEGAGSPVEMNLNDRELVNMKVAELANVPVILVADIDRGGIFASIAGTLQLLSKDERKRVIGVVINKFRGDPTLFESGKAWIEEHLHVPVLAVLPYVLHHRVESEDSLARQARYQIKRPRERALEIAMIDLPYLANDTDLEPFRYEPDVAIRLVGLSDELGSPDAVILPGTQSPIRDLQALKQTGLAEQLRSYVEGGGTIIGISSGYHMLGNELKDGTHAEKGLELIPLKTMLSGQKSLSSVNGTLIHSGDQVTGFAVSHGEVTYLERVPVFAQIDGKEDGVFLDGGRIIGTAIHHAFYNDHWRASWLNRLRKLRSFPEREIENYHEERLRSYDELADWLERELDVDLLLTNLKTWKKRHG